MVIMDTLNSHIVTGGSILEARDPVLDTAPAVMVAIHPDLISATLGS
jgi:hypothetical protein